MKGWRKGKKKEFIDEFLWFDHFNKRKVEKFFNLIKIE